MKTTVLFLTLLCVWGCRENAGTDPENDSDPSESLLQVETLSATDVTDRQALCRGKVINKNDRMTAYGIELFRGDDPEAVIHRKTDALFGNVFGISLSGLEPQQAYRFRAFADDGTLRYGNTESFTTREYVPLQVETLDATGVASTGAQCGGKVTGGNGAPATWGIELFYEDDTVVYERSLAFPGDEFKLNISGLGAQQPYRFRAFADDGETRYYGEDRQFTTAAPTVIAAYIPLADPFILIHKGVYYAYGTRNEDVGSGFSAYISHDLLHWRRHPTQVLNEENCWGNDEFWAPEVHYRADDQIFYMFYSAERHICVATSTSPLGPFKQQVQQPMRANPAIDNTLFVDDDGKEYCFCVMFSSGNVIWCAEMADDRVTVKEATKVECLDDTYSWEGNVLEGPSVLKHNGVYYCLYSTRNYQDVNYAVNYATASSPTGPWTKAPENPILQQPRADLAGTGHGAFFTDKNGQLRYVFHAHYSPTTVHPRKMYITDMNITDDGKIVMDKNSIICAKEYR